MPAGGGSYGEMTVGGSVATTLKRAAAKKVSYDQTNVRPRKGEANGKFAGLPGGASGGTMGSRGKRRGGEP